MCKSDPYSFFLITQDTMAPQNNFNALCFLSLTQIFVSAFSTNFSTLPAETFIPGQILLCIYHFHNLLFTVLGLKKNMVLPMSYHTPFIYRHFLVSCNSLDFHCCLYIIIPTFTKNYFRSLSIDCSNLYPIFIISTQPSGN